MDKTIFEVEISNSGPKSYETATVMKMPASFAEFSDALQKARIKDGSFCKNELTCIHYNGLTHAMIGWNANLYDLNLFAQRLASLTEEQKKGMDALLKIKQNHRVAPIPLNQLIMDFTEGVFRRITSKPKSIRSEVNESTRRKKKSFLRREIEETQTILRMTGRAAKFPMVCALSLLLFLVGAAFALTLGNLFLVPVLAVGMMFVPFWFIRLTANHYKKNIAAELETALSIITTAYLRNEDIQTAVEENIDYLNPPVRSVFVEFLTRIKLVDPDVDAALQDMGTKIDNAVFREWVAALLTCRHDRGLKTILTPIVAKLSDMRIVNGELENLVFEPRKEFITMQVLVIGNIPLLYWLNQDWYDVLMHTPLGQALLAAIAAVMFISTAAVIKLTQPIEYRR